MTVLQAEFELTQKSKEEILKELENMVTKEDNMNEEEKKEYKTLLEKKIINSFKNDSMFITYDIKINNIIKAKLYYIECLVNLNLIGEVVIKKFKENELNGQIIEIEKYITEDLA